ncbi:MAG: translation initiation factor IF-2, partial [Maribacter sp.]|nr:translation initiation factor IF-2 [Maribacter sp.]
MADNATIRLNKVLRELNISLDRVVEFLKSKGHEIEARPTTKISEEVHQVLLDEFQTDMSKRVASQEVGEEKRKEKEAIRLQLEQEQEERRIAREKRAESAGRIIKAKAELSGPKTVGKIDLEPKKKAKAVVEEKKAEQEEVKEEAAPVEKIEAVEKAEEVVKKEEKLEETPSEEKETPTEDEKIATQYKKLSGPKILGDKIDLSKFSKPKKKKEEPKTAAESTDKKKRRKRIVSSPSGRPGK